MPAQYAHNKFGKLVIPNLDIQIKTVIKKYPRPFRIGLQGPDFLFFYITRGEMTSLGRSLHHSDTYDFVKKALGVVNEYGKDSPQYSYILGLICHFTLDNACHPYVNKFMKTTDCGHVEIEGELDRLILSAEDFAPEFYPLYKLVPTDYETAFSMAPFYRGLSTQTIQKALIWMKRIKKFFVAPSSTKRFAIDLGLHATLHYKRLCGHMMMPRPNPNCCSEARFLYRILKLSVEDAAALIRNFNDSLDDSSLLSKSFHRDFNGTIY